jgi:amino acid transporter/nucleotide-binding universal stress UspA family protein
MQQSKEFPPALSLLRSERPRNVGWLGSAGLLFGDWGTSRLYVLGLAFLVAGRSSFWLVCAMSVLILAVAWAYTQICRIYPDGGGVYTAARQRSALLGVVGALLLFADYTVTASLSAVEAFHYFGLGDHPVAAHVSQEDAGSRIILHDERAAADAASQAAQSTQPAAVAHPPLPWWNNPPLWAIVSIALIGLMNLLGPKHSSSFAIVSAVLMMFITLLIVAFALPQLEWSQVPERLGPMFEGHQPIDLWRAFVAVVLALSGVEAIANLTGVMKKPVVRTASRAIWIVATEVALFNIILALVMCTLPPPLGRNEHLNDMLAFMAGTYIGDWGEWPVRVIAGVLLLSAANTALGALMGTLYVMSRDGELPRFLQKLNAFGAPWAAGLIALSVPALVLVFVHELEPLSHLYAIGIVGAVAINCSLCAFHPRLRRAWRKAAMGALGLLLVLVWITLAVTKVPALIFVTLIMVVGLGARQFTRWAAARRARPTLLQEAIREQLTPDALARPKLLLATAGSDAMAEAAMDFARQREAALVVCFVREVALSYKAVGDERELTIDTDPAAQQLFTDFLEHGHRAGVPIIPMYDTGPNSAELIAEHAAMNAVSSVLIGTSRRGAFHRLVKGSFQKKLESLLPPDIPVTVLSVPSRA